MCISVDFSVNYSDQDGVGGQPKSSCGFKCCHFLNSHGLTIILSDQVQGNGLLSRELGQPWISHLLNFCLLLFVLGNLNVFQHI